MTEADTHTEKYELVDRVAVGGMAEVYRAKAFGAHGFEKTLAIKRILPELAAEPEFEQRFIAEAKLAVSLSHANVVQVLDFGRFAGSLFIAMEFVDGLDLAALLKWLKDHGRQVPLPAAFQIAIEICRGLDFAHKHGVIHRDVSPSNILLSRAGEVKVADFGIAQAVSKRSSAGGWKKIMGKWRYMSPEQTRGDTLTTQSDLFSLASMLYEVFTGDKLFPGDEPEVIAHNIESMTLPSASVTREGLPARFDEVLFGALARRPEDRTETAAVMQRLLTEICYESSILATPLDVSELVTEVVGEVSRVSESRAAAKAEVGINDLIRAQLIEGMAQAEVTRRTAVDDADEGRRTAVTAGPAIVSRRTGSDGITVWELDRETMAAAPSAIRGGRRPTGTPPIASSPVDENDAPEERDSVRSRRRAVALGLGVAAFALAGLGYLLTRSEAVSISPIDAGRSTAAPDALLMEPDTKALLRIDSIPPGASVTVNGTAIDAPTPISIPVAPNQPNTIRLELEGYEPWEEQAVIVPLGETFRIRPRLAALVASLSVITHPDGAEVFVDDERLGVTPLERADLRPGKGRLLTVRKEGYRSLSMRIDLDVERPLTIDRQLKGTTVFGHIDLHIDDGWAEVYLRGKKIGRAPARGLRLPLGKHKLRLFNPPSGRERFLDVEVVEGETRYYRTRL